MPTSIFTLSVQDCCRYLGISQPTFRKLTLQPDFPRPTRVGSRSYWCPDHLAKWQADQQF